MQPVRRLAGADLFREKKNTAGWLLVLDLFREKNTAGRPISQTNPQLQQRCGSKPRAYVQQKTMLTSHL
jgi:hypothetical protein